MINPNRVHRAKAIVINKGHGYYTVRLDNGHELTGYDLPDKIQVGDRVNIQASFSIMSDRYVVRAINNNPSRSKR